MIQRDARTEVLADLIREADADLEQREAPKPEAKPEPMDPATRRLMNSDGYG